MAKQKKPLSYTGANEMDAMNIVLVVNNDPWLHNTRKVEFQKNLLRKRQNLSTDTRARTRDERDYDFEKSIRLFRYLADEADKAERGVHHRLPDGSMYIDSSGVKGFTYSVPTRNLAARMFAEEFRDQVEERAWVGDDPYLVPYGALTYLAKSMGLWKKEPRRGGSRNFLLAGKAGRRGRLVGDEPPKIKVKRIKGTRIKGTRIKGKSGTTYIIED